jgi:alanine dehydrogenase
MAKLQPVNTLFLSTTDVDRVLTMEDALQAVETAYRLDGQKLCQMPGKVYLIYPEGDLRVMPCYIEKLKLSTVKIVNVHPKNLARNLKPVMATIIMIDPDTGSQYAIMDGSKVTDMRTGAAGAVAARFLARKNPTKIGFCGCGFQAITQLRALLTVFKTIKEIRVFDVVPGKGLELEQTVRKFFPTCPKFIQCTKCEDAVRGMDIVTTVTPSRQGFIQAAWLTPGQHLNCIGADAQGKQELVPDVLLRPDVRVVIDNWAQASHSGEINLSVTAGIFSEANVAATIGEVVAGLKPGRTADSQITIFCSTGLALQDALTAKVVYDKACAAKLGTISQVIIP